MERVARGLEEKFPQLKDDVTNSLLLFREGKRDVEADRTSEGLIAAQLRKTVREAHFIRPWQVVSLKEALRHLRLLLPLALTFSLVFAMDPHFLGRSLALILHPFSNLPMKETFISLDPQGAIVLRGTEVVIKAKVTGNVPDKLTLTIWPEDRDAKQSSHGVRGKGEVPAQDIFGRGILSVIKPEETMALLRFTAFVWLILLRLEK